MSRILLADDSPHAQRMGERILREEGYEVVSVTDGDAALLQLPEISPDLIVADAFLPQKSGFEVCRRAKADPRFRHARVVLTAGLLEPYDEEEGRRAGADAVLKKPFEASVMLETVRALISQAEADRENPAGPDPPAPPPVEGARSNPGSPLVIEAERVRAAVTVALDAAFPALVDEITERVLIALGY